LPGQSKHFIGLKFTEDFRDCNKHYPYQYDAGDASNTTCTTMQGTIQESMKMKNLGWYPTQLSRFSLTSYGEKAFILGYKNNISIAE